VDVKIFISSTRQDLDPFRDDVIALLRSNGKITNIMEGFGSRGADSTEVCRREIEGSDILVGIYAFRYGFVPPGSEASITELEFNYALERGKRCLCYVADQGLAAFLPSDGRDDDVKRFKDKVSDLVITTFNSASTLAARISADVARVISGDPVGISLRALQGYWSSAADHFGNLLTQNQFLHHTTWHNSPLSGIYREFTQELQWHRRLLDALTELKYDVSGMSQGKSYEALSGEVKRRLLPEFERKLLAMRSAERYDRKEVEKYESTLAKLRVLVEQSEFNRCLLVLGSMGAGKTHFLLHMLLRRGEGVVKTEFPLLLDREAYENEPLNVFLLESVNRWSQQTWYSLAEIDLYMTKRGFRLVFMIDDIQSWMDINPNLQNQLRSFIASATAFHSFFWIITCRDKAYYRITMPHFWKRYGYRQEASGGAFEVLGGWQVLDERNTAEGIGFLIIRAGHADSAATILEFAEATRISRSRTFINNPLFAWTLAELSDIPLASIATFNYIDFIEKYWDSLRGRLVPLLEAVNANKRPAQPLEETDLTAAINFIADKLTQSGTVALGAKAVRDAMCAAGTDTWLAPEEAVPLLLDVLAQGNIISIGPDLPVAKRQLQAAAMQGSKKVLRLNNDTFWAYLFAMQLSLNSSEATNPEKMLSESLCRAGIAALQEDILHFFLLLLDEDAAANGNAADNASVCWRASVEDDDLPSSAPWFAGPQTGCREVQSLIGSLACDHPTTKEDPRELFSYLYFNSEAVPVKTLTYPGRMENFRQVFPHIAGVDYDLSSYLGYVIRRILSKVGDNGELVDCLHSLRGCHAVGIAEEVGKAAFDKIFANAAKNVATACEVMKRYAREAEEYVEEEYAAPRPQKTSNQGWERTFLREFVLKEFCYWLTQARGVAGYKFLKEQNWYGARGKPFAGRALSAQPEAGQHRGEKVHRPCRRVERRQQRR
jgi:hypothetical protein